MAELADALDLGSSGRPWGFNSPLSHQKGAIDIATPFWYNCEAIQKRLEYMKLAVEEVSSTKRIFKIEVPEEEVNNERKSAYEDLNKRVRVPGFRPGKIPFKVLETRYSNEVESEILKKLLPRYYNKALEEVGVNPVELPSFDKVEFKKNAPLSFTASVEVRPKMELSNYIGIEVPRQEAEVTEQEVEEALKRLQEVHARLESFEEGHTIEKADYVILDFEGFIEDKPVEGGKAENFVVQIGSGGLLPTFDEKLIGAKKNDDLDIKVSYPEDHKNKAIAGKEVSFKVRVKEVKKKILSELNDAFARDMGNFDSLAKLKEYLKGSLEIKKKKAIEDYQKDVIVKKLIEANNFDLPPSMVERQLQRLVQQAAEPTLQEKGKVEEEEIKSLRQRYEPVARDSVKGVLILEEIADKEKIDVTYEEVEEEMKNIASNIQRPLEEVKRYFAENEGRLSGIFSKLREEKTMNFLLSKVVFKESSPAEASVSGQEK